MTFKHIKFDDSPVMRSFEKQSVQKGLIKPEQITKEASKKTDLDPTDNLSQNLMKLCNGLRQEGFDTYADDLETYYVMYKKANLKLDTDLIEAAHPKGSHQLEGVDGDALIETILDQQLADLKMIDKKVTGKLSNAKEIINAVKVVLSQDKSNSDEEKILATINKLIPILNAVTRLMIKELNAKDNISTEIISQASNPTRANIINIKESWQRMYTRAEPSWYGRGVAEDIWLQNLKPLFNRGFSIIGEALTLRNKIDAENENKTIDKAINENNSSTSEKTTVESNIPARMPSEGKSPAAPSKNINATALHVAQLIKRLNSYTGIVNLYDDPADIKAGMSFINLVRNKLTKIHAYIVDELDKGSFSTTEQTIKARVSNIEAKIDQFNREWIAAPNTVEDPGTITA